MSTQQDIYAAGSESRPPMLNKENYVPWSSRLLRYAKSRPNGKLIHNSILNGPYVRRMIPEPGDANREVTVTETFHVQTDDELYDKEIKQIEADDQAIQTILLDPTTAMNMALALMAKAFKLNYSSPTNNNQRISSNLRNRQIAQPSMNMGQDRLMQMVEGNGGNQFRQYAGNLTGYNDVQNIANRVIQNAVQNLRVQNIGNQNGLIGAKEKGSAYLQTQLLIAQKEEAEIQLQAEEYDLMAAATDLDEIEEVNANCILMANLQQASTSGTQTDNAPVYDSDGSAKVHENCDDNEIFNMFTQEEQYTELLEPIIEPLQVPQNDNGVTSEVTSVEQGGKIVEQHSANFEETPGSESRPPMLNKENYVPWSSRLLRYAKSRPNEKLIHNNIINGPYVIRMIPEPGDTNQEILVNETFHVQTDDKLTEKELKQIEADDQAIQTILLGLPEDIYAAVDSCETAQEIWLRVQRMMKGSNIGIQEKKAKLFNEWERFTSNEGESIESYYHRFLKLMNDLKRNKHFPKTIASNLKFLNNLQPEWSRHVTIVHQTKDLHTADYTQLYDFLKYNQKEVDELKAERLAKTQDPLALMANSNNPYAFLAPHQDQPSFNQNYMQQPMPNPEDIANPTTAINMALTLMAKAFKLNYSTPTYNNQRISSNPRNRAERRESDWNGLIGVQGNGNQNQIGNGSLVAARAEGNAIGQNGNQIRCYNYRGVGHYSRNCTVRPRRKDAAYLETQLLIAQKEEAGIQLQAEEFDLMAAVADLDEIEEVNANCILMANLQQASTSGTQSDKAPVYDSDRSAEVHDYENCDDNEIFNMFTQEEKYTELLEHILDQHQVLQNDNNVISEVTSMEQSGEILEQHPANFEETRALHDSLYQNLAIEVEKVNSVNRTDLTTELARFKNQEKYFEISQEKYDKLERCYQQSVYQEQCLSKKINDLHLITDKQIMTLNEQISDLNKHLSKEKSTVSFLLEEKKG
nr:hypothetical protein [Tanacetum cinerariifolium]